MNDYYTMLLDIESDSKNYQDECFESWLEYQCDQLETPKGAMYKKTINGYEIEIDESQYAGKLCLTIRDQESDRLVFNLDLDYDDYSISEDDSCYGHLVKLAQDWVKPSDNNYDDF